MASGGGKYAIGRFFVSQTPQSQSSQNEQDSRSSHQHESSHSHSSTKGSRKAHYVSHVGHKRVKKFMPISYPEPTIQEETSPNDSEVILIQIKFFNNF